METLDPNSLPNKRLKTETLTLDPLILPSSAKGKAPISEEVSGEDNGDDGSQSPAELPPQNCGVCFSDEGKSVRGLIDSCDHYFCFLCIIEWSKIESRCPLCRARFSNIRRMRRDGSFIGEGSVRVPVRDQIYDPFGEPAADPYAQTKCTVCDGTTDESLLLLCDLCDSAWHTYCVGLGFTVPEGDWYCRDCALLRAEQQDGERHDNVNRSGILKDDDGLSSTSATVSIFDIVRDEEPDSSVDRLLKIASAPTKPTSLMIASDQASMTRSSVNVMESGARTLRNCRNVHRHISVLRENWDAFRTGSLSFPSNSRDFSRKGRRKMNVVASFPSSSTSQSKAEDTSSNAQPNKQPYNVDRAWKLMNIARSMQQVGPHKGASKTALNKARGSKADNVASNLVIVGSKDQKSPRAQMRKPSDRVNGRIDQRSERLQLTNIVPEDASTSRSKYSGSSMSRLFSSGKVQTAAEDDISHNRPDSQSQRKLRRGLSTGLDDVSACSMSLQETIAGALNASCNELRTKEISTCLQEQVGNVNACIASESGVQSSAQGDICHHRAGLTSQQNLGVLSNVLHEQKFSACSKSQGERGTCASGGSRVTLQGGEKSKCSIEVGTQTASKNDEAKVEIQSLVKLNLKLLSKGKRLGADAFKEIARISTHTILAACGYEHRKIVHSYQTLECRHVDQTQQPPSLEGNSFDFIVTGVTPNALDEFMSKGIIPST